MTVINIVARQALHSLSSNGVAYMGDWIVVKMNHFS